MGRREDLERKIGICDDQLKDFGSFKERLKKEVGLDLDTPYVDPNTFGGPLARRIFGEAQDDFMKSRENLYGKVGEIVAERAQLQAELDKLEGRDR